MKTAYTGSPECRTAHATQSDFTGTDLRPGGHAARSSRKTARWSIRVGGAPFRVFVVRSKGRGPPLEGNDRRRAFGRVAPALETTKLRLPAPMPAAAVSSATTTRLPLLHLLHLLRVVL